jgi:hypothetical protein
MALRLIHYRVKPEKSEEYQQFIGRVFSELRARAPGDVRYLLLKLSDGAFCHLVEDPSKIIAGLDSFAAFQRDNHDRRLDEPQQLEADVVGNYRMLREP